MSSRPTSIFGSIEVDALGGHMMTCFKACGVVCICICMQQPREIAIQSSYVHVRDARLSKSGTLLTPEMEPQAIELHSHMSRLDALALSTG